MSESGQDKSKEHVPGRNNRVLVGRIFQNPEPLYPKPFPNPGRWFTEEDEFVSLLSSLTPSAYSPRFVCGEASRSPRKDSMRSAEKLLLLFLLLLLLSSQTAVFQQAAKPEPSSRGAGLLPVPRICWSGRGLFTWPHVQLKH